MQVDSRLSTSKEYVWFLSNIEQRTIKGHVTLIMDWMCKSVDVSVREYLRVPADINGSRILDTMCKLGYEQNGTDPITPPQKFFEKGLHVKAKPLIYWSELDSDSMKWKLNYETLSPLFEKPETIPPDVIKRLETISSSRANEDEVLAYLATHDKVLIKPFLQLSLEGKLKYKK